MVAATAEWRGSKARRFAARGVAVVPGIEHVHQHGVLRGRPHRHRRAGLAIRSLVVTAALALAMIAHPSSTEATTHGTAVVIGDSISNAQVFADLNHSKEHRVWWAKLGRKTDVEVHAYGERGSGHTHRGKCKSSGSTIGERIKRKKGYLKSATYVIVAAGYNDYRTCRAHPVPEHKFRPTKDAEVEDAVNDALQRLDDIVEDNGKVIITVPYGDYKPTRKFRPRIVRLLQAGAEAHGFQYVDTASETLWHGRTVDGQHPNAKGAQRLYHDIYRGTDLAARTRAGLDG